MHLCFKIVKFLLQSMSLYMFRTLLCPSSGAMNVKIRYLICIINLGRKIIHKCSTVSPKFSSDDSH
jgi:hypothetical protein